MTAFILGCFQEYMMSSVYWLISLSKYILVNKRMFHLESSTKSPILIHIQIISPFTNSFKYWNVQRGLLNISHFQRNYFL